MAFFLPDYIFPYYPSICHMEHSCKIAIIFPATVSIRSTNEFFKTRLTANSFFFYFWHLQQYVYSLSHSYLEIYRTTEVIRDLYYTFLMIEFPCLVCDKPVATNEKSVCCDLCDKWVHKYCNKICKNTYQKLKKITTLDFVNCVYKWKLPFLVSTILNSLYC